MRVIAVTVSVLLASFAIADPQIGDGAYGSDGKHTGHAGPPTNEVDHRPFPGPKQGLQYSDVQATLGSLACSLRRLLTACNSLQACLMMTFQSKATEVIMMSPAMGAMATMALPLGLWLLTPATQDAVLGPSRTRHSQSQVLTSIWLFQPVMCTCRCQQLLLRVYFSSVDVQKP